MTLPSPEWLKHQADTDQVLTEFYDMFAELPEDEQERRMDAMAIEAMAISATGTKEAWVRSCVFMIGLHQLVDAMYERLINKEAPSEADTGD